MTSARMETNTGRQPRRPHPSSCWTARSTSDGGTPPTERSQASTTPEGTWCPTSLVSISANSPGDASSFSRASRNWLRARAEKSSGCAECDPSASSCCMREAVPRWRCAISASRSAASMRWPASGRAEMNRTASAYARSSAVNAVPRLGAVFTSSPSPSRDASGPDRLVALLAGSSNHSRGEASSIRRGRHRRRWRQRHISAVCDGRAWVFRQERGHGAARPCAGPAPRAGGSAAFTSGRSGHPPSGGKIGWSGAVH